MTTYNPRPLVARQLEFTTGTIEVIWKVRPSRYNPDLDGRKEIFNTLQEIYKSLSKPRTWTPLNLFA